MASAPFNPDQTVPGDTDVAANYPAAERSFRDIVESWMLVDHDRYGHNLIGVGTETERDNDPNWTLGSLWYNTDIDRLEIATDDDPSVVWTTVIGEFDAGTRVVLQQTAAPFGYTKEVDSAYNDVALRLSTGTVTFGGTDAFSVTFAKTLTGSTVLDATMIPAHRHFTHKAATGTTGSLAANNVAAKANDADLNASYNMAGAAVEADIGLSSSVGGGLGHTHAMDIRVKFRDVCIFEKD